MDTVTFTFRVDQSLKDEFAALAKMHDRSGAQLLRDFMRDYIGQQQERDAWFKHEVQRGVDAANAGDLVSAEEVKRDAAAWRAATKRKLSGNGE